MLTPWSRRGRLGRPAGASPALGAICLAIALVLAWTAAALADHVPVLLPADLAPPATPAPATPEASAQAFLAAIPAGHRAVAVVVEPGADAQITVGPHTCTLDGHRLAAFQVARWGPGPVQVTVITEPDAEAVVRRLRPDARRDASTRERLRRLVANPEAVEVPAAEPPAATRKAKQPDRGFAPSSEPSLEGSAVSHLIITSEALAPAFEPLAAWRTARGISSQIRTIEWIEARARHGVDRAETIRNFLIEAYQLWGIEWVLLGGDTSVVPARFGRSAAFVGTPDEFLPTDLYYGCLDGTWNGDGDGYWGEGAPTQQGPSEADMLPELHVGRAPVRTPAEVTTFIDKLLTYETPVYTDYQNQVALFHEVLVPANWDSSESVNLDGASIGQLMIQNSIPPEVTPLRYYDTYWLYPGSTKLTKAATLAQLDQSAGVMNHLGHGYRYTMSVGDISIVNGDADLLSNGDRTFMLFMANCAAAAFDYDCLAEHYLRNPDGGASAVIGATRSVSAIYVLTYNQELMRQLYVLNVTRLAPMLDEARLVRAGHVVMDNHERQVQLALTALGDPATLVFNGAVRATTLVCADTVVAGDITLAVGVLGDSLPVAGAAVCAMKAGEVYTVGETDSTGTAWLAVSPRTGGPLVLTVTGPNITSPSDTVQVVPSPPALLHVTSVSIDDDAVPPSAGNGDGVADAGEIVELDVVLENTGGTAATGITMQLTSPDSNVAVLLGGLQLAELLAADSLAVTDSLCLQIPPWVRDGTRITLPVQLAADGDSLDVQFQDTVRFTVAAPRLEVMRVQAFAGATTELEVEIKNYGSGVSAGLLAALSGNPPVVLLADTAAAGLVPPYETATLAPRFQIDVSGGNGSGVSIVAIDTQGRSIQHDVDLVPPAPPAGLVSDVAFAPGVMRVLWNAPADPDLVGYHVFRAPLGGSFERVTPDFVVHRDFRDSGVLPASQYDYYVVAVDSSRQWSAPSETLQVATPVAVHANWPQPLWAPTSSSVVVGDIDADGTPEIVLAADNVLYAWRGDRQEVYDGDADSTTAGVLSPGLGAVSASVALANLDAAPGLEIVVAAWLTNTVRVLDATGALLPGWPQQPANPGTPGFWASPAVGDVDGDGSPEIVAVSKDGYLYAWHADGSPLIPETNGAVRLIGAWTQNTPALADLDGDGACEIIAASSLGYVHVITATGSDYAGWPLNLGVTVQASPAVGDVDDDGTLEIVVTSRNDQLHVFEVNGTYQAGFPTQAPSRATDMGPSPALGDLNGDGKLEIVVPTVPHASQGGLPATQLRVYDWQGLVLFTKPLGNQTHSSPVLADLDGNGNTDVVIGGETGVLYAWDANGNDILGFPVPLGAAIQGTPTYADVNEDGFGDLVFAGADVYVWSMPGVYARERAPWPTFHADAQRRGLDPPEIPTPVWQDDAAIPRRLVVQLAPNPFNPRVTVRIAVPASDRGTATARGTHVRVDVYDVRGQLVRRLVDRPLPAGWCTETWDGRDDEGRALSSGVYFYSVRASGTETTGKVTLLR